MTELGYLGVDLVIDHDRGPLLLEMNARPGLAIQLANRAGLDGRLKKVDRASGSSPPERGCMGPEAFRFTSRVVAHLGKKCRCYARRKLKDAETEKRQGGLPPGTLVISEAS
jgi:hypothetical protein